MSRDWTKIESETIDWLRPVMACKVFIAVLAVLFMIDIWFPVSGFGIKATFFFSWGALFSIKGKSFIE